MWHEYPIPADFNKQKEIIQKLRNWIQQLENDNLIDGFAFNHGLINSLGIPKNPDERAIHIKNLMDSTNSRTKQELINWLQTNLKS